MEFDTKLYFITDSTGFERDEFLSRVRSALEGGVTILQLREKNRTTREYIDIANAVHSVTKVEVACLDYMIVLFLIL